MEELLARIEALGRRAGAPTAAEMLEVGDLRLDVLHRRVTRAGKALTLSPREFDVLLVLMQEPGRIFSRTELCELVWQREHAYDMRTVDIVIGRLRKKVDAGFAEPLIHTSRALGYTVRAVEKMTNDQ
jgi:DNA-binding response OmpR family regulator